MFECLDAARTGIKFANNLSESDSLNILNYVYYFNGGGTGIADFNNDGLPDLYVANDFGRNNLYLQSRGADGKPQFRDVTDAAGLSEGAFGMSASSGDFNRDGWPDIHLGAMFSSAGSRITSQSRFRPELAKDVRDRFRRLARGNTLAQQFDHRAPCGR